MPGLLIVPGRAGTTTSVATIRTMRGMAEFFEWAGGGRRLVPPSDQKN
jgi:hypothetical protein